MLRKKGSFILILMLLLFSPPLVDTLPAQVVTFFDDFDGSGLDTDNWFTDIVTSGVRWRTRGSRFPECPGSWQIPDPTHYGEVVVANSMVTTIKPEPTQLFPYFISNFTPFPDQGDFTLYVYMKYNQLGPHGTGVTVRYSEDSRPVGDNCPSSGRLLRIWQDRNYPLEIWLGGEYWRAQTTDDNWHLFQLELRDGLYTAYIDGFPVVGPVWSDIMPNTIWFGNPVWAFWRDALSTTFSVDWILVTAP